MSDIVYLIEMEGDKLYYAATTEDEAYKRFYPTFPVPRNLLKFTRMKRDDVPADEEVL
jgi:hypothetical protein